MINSVFNNDPLTSRSPMFNNSTLISRGGYNNGYPFPLAPMFEPQLPDWAVDDPQLRQVLRDMGFIPDVAGPPGATNNANASGTAGGEGSTERAGLAGATLDEEMHQSSTEVRVGGVTAFRREFHSRRSESVFMTRPSPATANGKQGATSSKGDEEQGVPTDGDEQRAPTEQDMKELLRAQKLAAK